MAEEKVTQPLEIKYRPINFDELIGWDKEKESLLSVIKTKRTFLLHGLRGCGKTTIGRLIAYHMDTDDFDIIEIDAADNTGVDDARELKRSAGFFPMKSKHKVYIIDEVHRLSGSAFDALLKTLEEPPDHCIFVLCTSELQKVPATIKSRAASYEVRALERAESAKLLDWICSEEKIIISDKVKWAIIKECDGIPREMVCALGMVREMTNDDAAISIIATADKNPQTMELCQLLLAEDNWDKTRILLKDMPGEPEKIKRAIMGYMYKVILGGTNNRAADILDWCMSPQFAFVQKEGLALLCYKITTN